jgi:ribonuclease D
LREIELVSTQDALTSVVAEISATTLVAVDTEFVRETTYYPKLCLVQIATTDLTACIDCLAPLDLEPLYAALLREGCTWVLHSARQDLEVIFQRTGRLPSELIDTQVAAALLGFAPQIGLEALLERTLGVELGENFARTDWSRRPLPAAALRYALDDVRHLLPAWQHLQGRLADLGRTAWLEEEGRRLLAEPPVADVGAIWARLKGARAMTQPQHGAALALVQWREERAQRADRPRRWLLADETLLAIAQAIPKSLDDLRAIVPARLAAKHGVEILAAVAGHDAPPLRALVEEHATRQAPERERLKELQDLVRRRAAELGIEPEILATRRDLIALAAGSPPAHLVRGWRAAELTRLSVLAPALG